MNHTPKPISIEELRKLRKPLRDINIEHEQGFSALERFAVWMTERVGTAGFFLVIFVWTIFWLTLNTLGPQNLRFDPFPAFVLWLFISNMIQLFLLPLIMIGQNLQNRHLESRAEADYEVNIKAEREIEAVLMHLEYQNELISKILQKTEKDNVEKIS